MKMSGKTDHREIINSLHNVFWILKNTMEETQNCSLSDSIQEFLNKDLIEWISHEYRYMLSEEGYGEN